MKRILVVIAVLGLAASLGAQSLTDLAKKEKVRREGLKGRHAAVVTNADLLRVQKTAAVEVVPPEPEGSEVLEGEDQGAAAETGATDNTPSGSAAPSGRRMVPRTGPDGPLITGDADRDQAEGTGTLDAQLRAAKDLVDLLTTKMNALRQQFESQDAMVPGYVIQQQLDETNQRLLKAQAQQARIEAQIAKKATSRKAPGEVER
jgi:type II secretory pathway pseudopilin PulG